MVEILLDKEGRVCNSKPMEVKYGLPQEIKFCKRCVISNQRPNSAVEYAHMAETKKTTIFFDENGVCDACLFAEKKKNTIKWDEREKELWELCNKHRKNNGEYDCIVPGSGGKDSFYAAHLLKYKYGMHPLTITWAPHSYTPWGWSNFQAWIHAGFDNQLYTPNGRVHRLLTRLAVENLFHPFQPFVVGQKSLAAKIAALHNIPLVFYGENEAEYGNPISDADISTRDQSFFSSNEINEMCLSGVSVSELQEKYDVHLNELTAYLPVNINELEKKKIEVHYLGYYVPWHPQEAYYYSVEHGGFKPSPERTPGTYSKYNSIDDKIDDFHYFTTFIKFGIGRASYDAAQEIRNQEITREEGVTLVEKYDGEFPERFAEEIFQYLSITEKEFPKAIHSFEHPAMNRDYFMNLTDKFRSEHLWVKKNGLWLLRDAVYMNKEKKI